MSTAEGPILSLPVSLMPPKRKAASKSKKAVAVVEPVVVETPEEQHVVEPEAPAEPTPTIPVPTEDPTADGVTTAEDTVPRDEIVAGDTHAMEVDDSSTQEAGPSISMADRLAKMQELRSKMVRCPYQGVIFLR